MLTAKRTEQLSGEKYVWGQFTTSASKQVIQKSGLGALCGTGVGIAWTLTAISGWMETVVAVREVVIKEGDKLHF